MNTSLLGHQNALEIPDVIVRSATHEHKQESTEILRLWTTPDNFAYSIKGGTATLGMWMEALALVASGLADDIAAHTVTDRAEIITKMKQMFNEAISLDDVPQVVN